MRCSKSRPAQKYSLNMPFPTSPLCYTQVLAANKVTAAAGGPEPTASDHRQALLSLDVLSALMDMLGQSRLLRTAAAQALCNLALEAASGTAEAAERHASITAAAAAAATPQQPAQPDVPRPAWRVLFDALGTLVPGLCSLLLKVDTPEGPVTACQALANLMRGAAFVPRVLKPLGPLPALARRVASASEPLVKQMFAQMLLNATLHSGTAAVLDSAEATQVYVRRAAPFL